MYLIGMVMFTYRFLQGPFGAQLVFICCIQVLGYKAVLQTETVSYISILLISPEDGAAFALL